MSFGASVKGIAEQVASRVVGLTLLSTTTARGFDTVAGWLGALKRARRMQPYGLAAWPPKNSTATVIAVRAGRGNLVYVAADPGNAPVPDHEGDTILYNTVGGQIIRLDKDGNIILVPKAGAKVKIGDGTDANLDRVVLYSELKDWLDKHVHQPGSFTTPMGGGSVTGTSGTIFGSSLPTSASSSNVVAKK